MPPTRSLHRDADSFRKFAADQAPASPLYRRLGAGVAEDGDLLEIGSACPPTQPLPVLFLGAVHDLLLAGVEPEHPLRQFYPSVGGNATGDPLGAFRNFCFGQAGAIAERLRTRRCQTNEVRRCTLWIPVFALAATRAGRKPLALIEVGASAGFNLLWDRYGYDYGDGRIHGNPASELRLSARLDGDRRPSFPVRLPAVADRLGIDLHPVDLEDPLEVRWLQALVWADQPDRRERLDRAIAITRAAKPPIFSGDALRLLPGLATTGRGDRPLLVYHSFTLNQFTPEERSELDRILTEAARDRLIMRAGIEWLGGDRPEIELVLYRGGRREALALGTCDNHGAWLEWGA